MASSSRHLCLALIGLLLAGYFLADRGFAHLGIGPIYVGDIVLILCTLIFFTINDYRIIGNSTTLIAIIIFDLWCLSQTIPYIPEYGLDAIRDAALYGYSFYAFLVAACAFDSRVIATIVGRYAAFIYPAVLLLPFMLLITAFEGAIDITPLESMPIVALKAGDVAVGLAGAMAFHMLGLSPRRWGGTFGQTLFFISWGGMAVWSSQSRGAILSLCVAILIVIAFGYGRRFLAKVVVVVVIVFLCASLLSFEVKLQRRELSVDQIFANVVSIFDTSSNIASHEVGYADLKATVSWRLNWWYTIIDHTIFGDKFWTGQGFGVNLADLDGFQTDLRDHSLRSPHNVSMTVLERAGVPGLVLWLLLQGAFVFSLASEAIRLRRTRYEDWARLNVWILAYWGALFVNASFDVYLEGPQGGIMYWAVMGFGIAVVTVEKMTVDLK